jgi:hypothetical protein
MLLSPAFLFDSASDKGLEQQALSVRVSFVLGGAKMGSVQALPVVPVDVPGVPLQAMVAANPSVANRVATQRRLLFAIPTVIF